MAQKNNKKIEEAHASLVTANNADDLVNLTEVAQNAENSIINNVSRETGLLYAKNYCGYTLPALIQTMIESNEWNTEGGEGIKTAQRLAEQLRVPLAFNADDLYAAIDQYVAVEDKELLADICKNAVKTSNIKYGHKLLDNAVRTLVLEEKENKKAIDAVVQEYDLDPNLLRIPRLPKVLKDILDCYPKEYHHAVLSVAVACLSFHAEGVNAVYNETELYRLLWLDVILAEAAGGKSFFDRIKDVILKDVIVRDTKFYAEEDAMKNSAASGKKKRGRKKNAEADEEKAEEKTEVKKTRPIQYVGSTTSITELTYRTLNSEGHNLFMYTNEGAEFFLSCRRGPNTDTWTFLRKGVEGSEYVQSHHSVDTVSGICHPYLTGIFNVQPEIAIPEFNKHISDGTVSRLWITTVAQSAGAKRPRIKPFSEELLAEIADTIAYLKTLNENIELRRLHKAIDRWLDEKALEYEKTDNLSIDHFRKRSAQMGYKVGVFYYLLNGRKENKYLIDFALYVAEYVCRQEVKHFGEEYNRLKKAGNTACGITNVNYYNMLSDTFTASQFSALRVKHGEAPNVRTIICRWRQKGLIEDVEKGAYRKLI
ncbi:MAG: DUF3987 domain-containing protein [Prevotellaceae bacterium]|nr:DUF3987 domain-containing protein [Candidatus Minthosoma equi]